MTCLHDSDPIKTDSNDINQQIYRREYEDECISHPTTHNSQVATFEKMETNTCCLLNSDLNYRGSLALP